jgi:hypothetical protein
MKMKAGFIACLLVGLVAGLIVTTANAQDGTQTRPQLLIKIHNIDQVLNSIDKLAPPSQDPAAAQPTVMARTMLMGTDWIDPMRSIVAAVVLKDVKPKCFVLIPFRTANANFQILSGAIAGENYYLMALPPEPGFSIDPVVKESLLASSATVASSSLVVEVAVAPLLDSVEAQMATALQQAETLAAPQIGSSPISPQTIQETLTGILKIMRQAETLRYGLDFTEDSIKLRMDIHALPGTQLAATWIDPRLDSRLMNYPIGMPIQYRSRAHDMNGIIDLLQSSLGMFYQKLGIDFNAMGDKVKNFTGEAAGGLNVSADGLAFKAISILQPGIDGDAFLFGTYLPWFEGYNQQLSELAAQLTGKSAAPPYVRSADSTVAGVKAIGFKTSANPILNNRSLEIRMAAVGDMLYMASDDAQLESLITGTRGLAKSAAAGPMARFDLQLGTLLKGLLAGLASAGMPAVNLDGIGNFDMTINAEMVSGTLTAQTSLNIADLRMLAEAMKQAIPVTVPDYEMQIDPLDIEIQ